MGTHVLLYCIVTLGVVLITTNARSMNDFEEQQILDAVRNVLRSEMTNTIYDKRLSNTYPSDDWGLRTRELIIIIIFFEKEGSIEFKVRFNMVLLVFLRLKWVSAYVRRVFELIELLVYIYGFNNVTEWCIMNQQR